MTCALSSRLRRSCWLLALTIVSHAEATACGDPSAPCETETLETFKNCSFVGASQDPTCLMISERHSGPEGLGCKLIEHGCIPYAGGCYWNYECGVCLQHEITPPPKGVMWYMDIVSGDRQVGPELQVLPEDLKVRITDVDGHPISGIPVSWGLTPRTLTDATGIASYSWHLGGCPTTLGHPVAQDPQMLQVNAVEQSDVDGHILERYPLGVIFFATAICSSNDP